MTNIPVVLSLVHSKTDYSVFITRNTDVSPFSCIATYVFANQLQVTILILSVELTIVTICIVSYFMH